jgi:hypothetical protein
LFCQSPAIKQCRAEIDKAMPAKPWSADMQMQGFTPLINLIDRDAQSDLFRHQGKYKDNIDYYDLAKELDAQGKTSGIDKDKKGVSVSLEQSDGWPTHLTIEDGKGHLKETVEMDPDSHNIKSDKVEYCGVSRYREWDPSSIVPALTSYSFPGGKIESTPNSAGVPVPVLTLEGDHKKP